MKLTLELADLLVLLSKQLGFTLKEEDVSVQADPFEVHISHVPTKEIVEPITKPVTTPASKTEDSEKALVNNILTIEQILNKSDELSVQGGTHQPRVLGPYESEEAPPITREELYARR